MRSITHVDYILGTPMTQDEKLFFKQLGARIAELRKTHGLTQAQLADTLDLGKQTKRSPRRPRTKQRFVVEMIETVVLAQQDR